jgi:protein SCO1/2
VHEFGTELLKLTKGAFAVVLVSALLAVFAACGSEAAEPTEQSDDDLLANIDREALAATAVAFQVQSVTNLEDSGSPIDPPKPMPEFSLTHHDGRTFGSEDLADKHVLLSFAYTHCPDVCPALFGHMLQVQKDMGSRIGQDLEMVIISVDPERDTPEWLDQRTTEMGGRWHFLTGTQQELEAVWADFGVRVEKQGEFVGHTGVTYLVTPDEEMTVRYPAYATFEHFIKGIEESTTEAG